LKEKIKELKLYAKDLKLLYVEDNRDTRDSTIPLLKKFFDEIVVAVDGQDGIEKFNATNPDIIFTDISMPSLDGLNMINEINSTLMKRVQVLIFSAHNESNYLRSAIRSKVDGYLIKPIELEQFVEELFWVLSLKQNQAKDFLEINKRYSWNKEAKKLYYMSQEIALTKNEITLFELMTSNIKLVYSDELIIEKVWSDALDVDKSNVKNLLKRLNSKLPQKLIKNIYAVGYSFV